MNNLWSLTKISLINSMGINKITSSKSKKERNKSIFLALMLTFAAVMIVFTSVIYSKFLADGLKTIGFLDMLLTLSIILTTVTIFFTSIYKAQGVLFSFKDYDLLMSLPIKRSYILIVKVFQLVLINYLVSIFTFVIPATVYFVYAKPSILFFVYLILIFLTLPLIPLLISSIISFGISYVSNKFKYKNLVITVGTLLIVVLIVAGSYSSGEFLQKILLNSSSINDAIFKIYPPAVMLTRALAEGSIIDLGIFLIISIGFFRFFIIVFNKAYKKISSKLQESYKKNNYKITSMKSSSITKALLIKEAKRYFASPIYVLNTIIGPVLLLIMAVATMFMGEDIIYMIFELKSVGELMPLMIIAVTCGILSLSCTTNSSISMEGKNLWILKSSPLNPLEIFKAKILLNLILVVPALIISNIIFFFSLNFSITQALWLFVISILFAIIVAILGIVVNLFFPNMHWISETAVVKQSASVMIQMLISAGIVAIPILAKYFNIISNNNLLLVSALIFEIIILAIIILILSKVSVKQFENLN
ncbi:MAG: ABC transporter permease [Clostridium sp.]|uniref:ABC transporter permease n=1 Tax=Clostridium sp. TaxID=1506 RepID=UPI00290A8154|nr:ABC transporter permease [Clostridium sp.]MDU5111410.1 ABC transporter permease [Clostridium sp.]